MYIENKALKNYISVWLFISFWLVALIIIVGGLTRLTDSGLSITQWQLFTGIFPPLTETSWNHYFDLYKKIPEYQLQNFSMSISEFKIIFWWEYIHRLLGRIIGLFFLLPLIFFTYKIGFLKVKFFFLNLLLDTINLVTCSRSYIDVDSFHAFFNDSILKTSASSPSGYVGFKVFDT